MPERPPIVHGITQIKDLEMWIDRTISSGKSGLELVVGLAYFSQPGNEDYLITPELFGNEGWFWPWNRGAFGYIKSNQPLEAAAVFKGAYLASLRVQAWGQYRIHKGNPLCNLAYAYLVARSHERARLPAILGMVEDALTNGNPTGTANFTNLRGSGFPEQLGETFANFFLVLFRNRGVVPLYPEVVLECSQRGSAFVSPEVVNAMKAAAEKFTPDSVEQSMTDLDKSWETFRPTLVNAANWRPADDERGGTTPASGPDLAAATNASDSAHSAQE